ncbi:MAG: hypothetical protein A2X68_13180 [Ignavibacteria bacterium GWC2_56_12]|nr:MAG: hypothetical protein A2X68_13180 [Ignavibacteria bacterium GWC2_56_12]
MDLIASKIFLPQFVFLTISPQRLDRTCMERSYPADRINGADTDPLSALPIGLVDGQSSTEKTTAQALEWKARLVAYMKKPLVLVAVTWMIIALLLAQELLNK